jgi:ATP-dependent protease ClpP protease subunit
VPAVTELIIAEMLYLQYKDRSKPMYLYINSTGAPQTQQPPPGSSLSLFLLLWASCLAPSASLWGMRRNHGREMLLGRRATAAADAVPAGTTRADGETVGFETEGTAIYDTMCFVKNEVGRRLGV